MGTPKDTIKSPAITDELIEWMDRLFPNECPELGTPIEKVWHKSGQVSVVARLRMEQKRQREGAV